MLHGSYAEALAATWFVAVFLDLHGQSTIWTWHIICVFGQNVWSSLESQEYANCSAPGVKQLQLVQAGQESQCGSCDVCPG